MPPDFKTLKDAGVTVYSDVVDNAAEWQAYAEWVWMRSSQTIRLG